MNKAGLLALPVALLVLGAIAIALVVGGGGEDSTSGATVSNSQDNLGDFTRPYSEYMTSELSADDVVPKDFGARVGPLKKDFDLGVEEWMSRYDTWSLPEEEDTGVPTLVSVIAFNNALVDWKDTHQAYHRVLESCAGQESLRDCSDADDSGADEAWSEGYQYLQAAEKTMHASAGSTKAGMIFED